MNRRDLILAVTASVVFGLVVGGGFAAYDWRLNPGGIFRGADGTNWRFMFDTTWSWFAPIVLTTFPLLLFILWAYRKITGQERGHD